MSDSLIDPPRISQRPPRDERLATARAPLAEPRSFRPLYRRIRRIEGLMSRWATRHLYPNFPPVRWLYSLQLHQGLTLRSGQLGFERLSRVWAGTRILLITDLHVGPFVTPKALETSIQRLLLCGPDLILLGGDFVTMSSDDLPAFLPALAQLKAPLGVVACLGNHDYFGRDAERIVAALEGVGARMLINDSLTLERDGERLVIGAIDDLLEGRIDFEATLAKRSPGDFSIVLSHHPDTFREASAHDVDLLLCGHTHAGQVRLPGLPIPMRTSRWGLDDGLYEHGATRIVVSRGLGAVGVPVRIGSRPEAVLLDLELAPSGKSGAP